MADDTSSPRVPAPPQYAPPEWSSQQDVASNITTKQLRSSRQAELDALRRKGLAKIFNKHFTSVHDSIRREQEAAELALRELERRKEDYKLQHPNIASNKSYQDEMSQLQRMCMELQRRKQTAMRKEKETMELYRRYVSQYGSNSEQALQIAAQMKRSSVTKPGNMPVLHEYGEAVDDDIVRQADLLMSKAMDRSGRESQISDENHVGDMAKNLENPPPRPSPTPANRNVGKVSFTGFTKSPPPLIPDAKATSYNLSSDTPPRKTSAVVSEIENDVSSGTLQPDLQSTTQYSVEEEGSDTAASNNTNRGASSLASAPRRSPATSKAGEDDHSGSNAGSYNPPQTSIDLMNHFTDTNNDDNYSDSDMSGLTMDGATIAEAEFKLLEFLKVETENIRRMMNGDEGEDSSLSTLHNDASTVRSLDSKKAQEAARKAENLAKEMEEASAWMNDPTLLQEEDKLNAEAEAPEKKKTKRTKEWCAYWSPDHRREYYFNQKTKQTTWTKPKGEDIDTSTLERNSSAQNQDDASKVVVKDYTKTNGRKKESTMMENMDAIEEFRPERRIAFDEASASARSARSGRSGTSSGTGRSSRIKDYKRRMARRRRKRRLRIAVALVLSATGLYFTRDRWAPVLEKHTGINFFSKPDSKPPISAEKPDDQKLNKRGKKVKRKKTDEEKRQEAEAAAELRRIEEERKEAEIAAAKKAEEERKRKEAEIAAKKKAEEERKRKEAEIAAAKKAEEERKRKEAEIVAAKKAEEERKRKEAEIAAKKKAEEERKLREAEEERQRKLEEARKRREAEIAAKKAEEERQRKLEEARKRREAELAAKKAEEERQRKLEEERKRREAELAAKKAEEERLRKIEEERKRKETEEKARIEAARRAEEERQRKEEEERLLREKIRLEVLREQEEERKRKEEEEKERQRQEEARIKAEEEAAKAVAALEKKMKRPPGCFVPLSYVVSQKCNFLAKEKPIYDVKGLTDSMMQ